MPGMPGRLSGRSASVPDFKTASSVTKIRDVYKEQVRPQAGTPGRRRRADRRETGRSAACGNGAKRGGKLPRTKVRNLEERGVAHRWAVAVGNTRILLRQGYGGTRGRLAAQQERKGMRGPA